MPTRKKPARGKGAPKPARARSARRARPPEPPPSLGQGLIELAYGSALSFLWVGVALVAIGAMAAAAFGVWSLRPRPSYASDGVQAGSPFDVTFRIKNTSAWSALSNLRIRCVLALGGIAQGQPIEASEVRFPAASAASLRSGETATFKCPFPAGLTGSSDDQLGVALRSEIYFQSEYDLPVVGSYRTTVRTGPYVLNTTLLPPRWTGKPGE